MAENKNERFYFADDIAEILSVSRPTAYRIIRQLNEELQKRGYRIVSGRVPRRFFEERYYA